MTFRGVAGAYLYTVNVDGNAIAILEDRQKDVRIILSSSGPGPGPRSCPGQVPGQVQKVQGLRTKDLDLG